ncbi:MAG TPA: HAMP domain-containing sensor histidine kinase [Rhizomicrobium sp.]|jgi:signal transduction histidine kinase|nr:HAMP domain-containing sensor histidine kinase [Rhizomicrobium sp.]
MFLRGASWNVRATVIVCVVLICGSFASAAVIQMQRDREHALSQATDFTQRRAEETATDLGAALDRYAAIGAAFASARGGAETSAALAQAGGASLRNIVVLDLSGKPVSEMMGAPEGLLPLDPETFEAARHGRTAFPALGGHSLVLLFAAGRHLVMAQIESAALLAPAGMKDSVLATVAGRLVAHGANWRQAPGAAALALDGTGSASRIVEQQSGARLVSLAPISGWPLVAGASFPVAETLDAWYGNFPLYLFFILGPAFAGAALAVLFVGVFERQAKAAASVKALRALHPGETRALVRLAEAERRAAEAERAKSRFVAQASHELRTPLNAIIGFAEIIEGGVFGTAGHPKYVEYSRDIGIAARELHSKIGSVLEYAALENDDEPQPLATRIADAAKVMRAQIALRAALARTRGLSLVLSLPDEAPVRADAHLLARIVAHLLDNALAYTPKGGTVRVELRGDERETLMSIRDTGAGFTKAERERAGQPFQRFARPGAPGGMGVGLAIAMALTRRLGATLSLSSLPGEGTLAELRLAAAVRN